MNVLLAALVIVVVGSLAGEWLSVQQRLGLATSFWVGHMGYEYVDLGRLWQILLFAGLFLWLVLMVRSLLPALRRPAQSRALLLLFVLSSAAIALFYGAALLSDAGPTSRSRSTGAGGSCTCGWRASSRCSPPW